MHFQFFDNTTTVIQMCLTYEYIHTYIHTDRQTLLVFNTYFREKSNNFIQKGGGVTLEGKPILGDKVCMNVDLISKFYTYTHKLCLCTKQAHDKRNTLSLYVMSLGWRVKTSALPVFILLLLWSVVCNEPNCKPEISTTNKSVPVSSPTVAWQVYCPAWDCCSGLMVRV